MVPDLSFGVVLCYKLRLNEMLKRSERASKSTASASSMPQEFFMVKSSNGKMTDSTMEKLECLALVWPKADFFGWFSQGAGIKSASSVRKRQRTMKNESTDKDLVSYTFDELDALPAETDWERVDAMTDDEIDARSDPDDPPLTEEELNQFKRAVYFKGQLVWEELDSVPASIPLPIDKQILEWFVNHGDDCMAQINAVLRAHIDTQETASR